MEIGEYSTRFYNKIILMIYTLKSKINLSVIIRIIIISVAKLVIRVLRSDNYKGYQNSGSLFKQ